MEWHWRIVWAGHCFAGFLERFFVITGTVSAVVWKTWLVDPTGISERLASYLLAFGMAILFSFLYPEKKTLPENKIYPK